jgi:hypothetical protein
MSRPVQPNASAPVGPPDLRRPRLGGEVTFEGITVRINSFQDLSQMGEDSVRVSLGSGYHQAIALGRDTFPSSVTIQSDGFYLGSERTDFREIFMLPRKMNASQTEAFLTAFRERLGDAPKSDDPAAWLDFLQAQGDRTFPEDGMLVSEG